MVKVFSMFKRKRISLLMGFFLLTLTACNTIEKRSESLPRMSLPEISLRDVLEESWRKGLSGACRNVDPHLSLATTGSELWVADCRGQVLALDPLNGAVIWKNDLEQNITAGPGQGKNEVLVATTEPAIVSLGVQDGEIVWTHCTRSEILAAPVVGQYHVLVRTLDDRLIALNPKTGKEIWSYQNLPMDLVLRKSSRPMVDHGSVYAGFANGALARFDEKTGELLWITELSMPKGRYDFQRMSDISADPAVNDNEYVFAVNYHGNVRAIRKSNGETVWTHPCSAFSGLTLAGNAVFLTDSQGSVLALNRRDGHLIWKSEALSGRLLSAPVLFHGILWLGDDEGYLHGLDPKNGCYLTRIRVDKQGIEATPLVFEDMIYVLTQGGIVKAFCYVGE